MKQKQQSSHKAEPGGALKNASFQQYLSQTVAGGLYLLRQLLAIGMQLAR
ncbi:hypothetical protein [Geopsychrobacter electrodiphilus]|nr:hypothetical protein [Geopsychrobacter electrodiphilus]